MQGTAPEAKLIMQSCARWYEDMYYNGKFKPAHWGLYTGISSSSALFRPAYKAGARVHTNSWGPTWDKTFGQLGYDNGATDTDQLVHENQDMVVLFAGGNDGREVGPGAGQLGGDAAAKNCITVGAIGTPRPNNGFEATTDGHVITGIEQIADFSSRGPTLPTDSEGNEAGSRIKPDLVAPGVAILSTASQTLPDNDPERTTYGKPPSHEWIYMTGTSMATPLAAGCVAVLRQAFKRENNNAEPSAALVKAFLMNRAVPLKGSQLPFRPDGQQRHGRVDLESSVRMTASSASAGFRDAGKSDALGVDGEWTSTTVTVPAGATLNATLAYPDPPGGKLQNDLNLIVEAGDGSKRYGNMGDDAGLDNVNNVEKVTWQGVPGGSARISVKVAGLTEVEKDGSDPTQEYAVVWEAK